MSIIESYNKIVTKIINDIISSDINYLILLTVNPINETTSDGIFSLNKISSGMQVDPRITEQIINNINNIISKFILSLTDNITKLDLISDGINSYMFDTITNNRCIVSLRNNSIIDMLGSYKGGIIIPDLNKIQQNKTQLTEILFNCIFNQQTINDISNILIKNLTNKFTQMNASNITITNEMNRIIYMSKTPAELKLEADAKAKLEAETIAKAEADYIATKKIIYIIGACSLLSIGVIIWLIRRKSN